MIATILALVAAAQASFVVDPNQPDGVYDYTPGQAAKLVRRNPISDKFVFKREGDGVQCDQAGAVLASNDIENARIALGPACDAGGDGFIPAYSNGQMQAGARYSKFGSGKHMFSSSAFASFLAEWEHSFGIRLQLQPEHSALLVFGAQQ